jgi:hypothetical protein
MQQKKRMIWLSCIILLFGMVFPTLPGFADDEAVLFAVVSEAPKDKAWVSVKAVSDGAVSDLKLLPSDMVQDNLIWRKLEICHAVKVEGTRVADGFKVTTVRVLDASMLPMTLQGFAGDCLIKKAIDVAPLVD